MSRIWINGRIVPADAPVLAAADRGFLLGDGCFSTLVAPGGQPFRLAAHWERLCGTAQWLGIDPGGYAPDEIAAAIEALLGGAESGLRLTLSRGPGGRGLLPAAEVQPTLVIAPFPLVSTASPAPARLTVAAWPVAAGNPALGHKLTSYGERMAAFRLARAAGYDEALFLNTDGHLTSATAGNLFIVRDGGLMTPPVRDGLLPGITRQTVLELAAEAGIPVTVRSLTLMDLASAGEVFLTGSRVGLWPVARAQGSDWAAPGIVTNRLCALYQATLRRRQPL